MRRIAAKVALVLALLTPTLPAARGASPAPTEGSPPPGGGEPAPADPAAPKPPPAAAPPAPTPPPADAAAPPPPPADAPPVPAAPTPAEEALARARNRAMGLALHGQELARAGMRDEAVTAFTEALDAWPAYPLAMNELALLFVAGGELARAEALLQQALALDPEFVAARANLAEVLRRLGRFAPAIDAYRAVLGARPDDADAHYGLAAAFARSGDKPAARWALERYLALAGPEATGPRVTEARAQVERLDDDDVDPRAPWAAAVAPRPSDAAPTDAAPAPTDAAPEPPPVIVAPGEPGPLPPHAGDAHYYARRYVQALASYAEALVATPDDVALLYKIGATHAVMNDYRSALRVWRRALLLAPSRELIVHHVGLATLKLAAQLPPAPIALADPLEAGRVALIAGDPAQALAALAGASDAEAALLRGEAQLLLGDLRAARATFEALLRATPDHVDAQGGLAEALARLGATAPAEAAMRAWLGDRSVPLETFLVLRANAFATRLTSEPEEP